MTNTDRTFTRSYYKELIEPTCNLDNSHKTSISESVSHSDKLYPVYITLFSNDTEFGKLIQTATKSKYTHATIALDPTMNNMYSFSHVPFTKGQIDSRGFVRESIWSPEYYACNCFTVLVTFVDKTGRDKIQAKIDNFINNYNRYNYNTAGIIQYYFGFKNTDKHDESKKLRWFCSEFVASCMDAAGVQGWKNIYVSPADIKNLPNVIELNTYTISSFTEKDLRARTKQAEKEFRYSRTLSEHIVTESVDDDTYDKLDETAIENLFIRKTRLDEAIAIRNSDIRKYTALVDWKKLYYKFIDLFPTADPKNRFDLINLIVTNILIPMGASAKNVTKIICDKMEDVCNKMTDAAGILSAGIINNINADLLKSTIGFTVEDRVMSIVYPLKHMNESTICETTISLAEKRKLAKERNVPVFICLFHFSSILSTVIAAVTKDEYTHSAISFDTSLTDMYSFGKFYPNNPVIGRFVHESLFGPTYNQLTKHAIYAVFVTPEEKQAIKDKLDWFIENKGKMRYNYEGLLRSLLKIPEDDTVTKYAYLCSEFVASILKSTGRDFISTPANLVKPNDFQSYPWCYYLGAGIGRAYDQKAVDRRLAEIMEERNRGNELYLETASMFDEMTMKYTLTRPKWISDTEERRFINKAEDFVKETRSKLQKAHVATPKRIFKNSILSDDRRLSGIKYNASRWFNPKHVNTLIYNGETPSVIYIKHEKSYSLLFATYRRNNVTMVYLLDSYPSDYHKYLGKFTTSLSLGNVITTTLLNVNESSDSDQPTVKNRNTLNEFMQTGTIKSREERDKAMQKYGLRKGGYGQRTNEEDEEKMKHSAEWEKKIPLRQKKKIYREDTILPGQEEFCDPDDVLKNEVVADDKNMENVLRNWYDGWTINTIPETDDITFEWKEQPDSPWFGTIVNAGDPDKIPVSEAVDQVLVDPRNDNMVKRYNTKGYCYMPGIENHGIAQPMFKLKHGPVESSKLYVAILYNNNTCNGIAISNHVDMTGAIFLDGKTVSNINMSDTDYTYAMYVVPLTGTMAYTWKIAISNITSADITFNMSTAYGVSDNPAAREICSLLICKILNSLHTEDVYFNDPYLITENNKHRFVTAKFITCGSTKSIDEKELSLITSKVLSEASVVLPFIKSFKIRIDKDGNIVINQREYNDFERHIQNSLRLLKSYRDTENYQAMKSELCRLYYMVELIDKYYSKGVKDSDYRKKLIDQRSIMLNAITNYLKLVSKNDPGFDFTNYYEHSNYGKEIKISPKGIHTIGQVIRTLL